MLPFVHSVEYIILVVLGLPLGVAQPIPMDPDNKIRVIKFKICQCSYMDKPHLRTRRKRVKLLKGNAAAIFYTWGEFIPQPVTSGHDRKMRAVVMSLGKEWPVEDVATTLTRIYREHSRRRGCWIDQLCIPQNDITERRKAIMKIPDIFRTFKTVIMMCGKPCKCFASLAGLFLTWRNMLNPELRSVTELENPTYLKEVAKLGDAAMDILLQRRKRCDLYSISSYFNRL